ncbi:MAG: DNA translocase FtsK 4TM domain-containing protein [Pseudomonadota bacterium]|nr:DNA translocase FtsK 4TM domain-containing protein [Pseudomonadota bacterium]
MSHAVRKRGERPSRFSNGVIHRLKEGVMIALGGVAMFLLVSLVSHDLADPGWSQTGGDSVFHNLGGAIGAWFSDVSFHLFGHLAFLFPIGVGYVGWLIFREGLDDALSDRYHIIVRLIGLILGVFSGCGLLWVRGGGVLASEVRDSGGILGDLVGGVLANGFGEVGGVVLMLACFLAGTTLLTGLSWLKLMDISGSVTLTLYRKSKYRMTLIVDGLYDYWRGRTARKERVAVFRAEALKREQREPPQNAIKSTDIVVSDRANLEQQETLFEEENDKLLPELNLLTRRESRDGGYSPESLTAMSRQVELKLGDFGIEVKVVSVQPGPVITRFELEPAAGVKASRITNLSKDLARALSAISVRVVEVIAGKTTIGLEIPNQKRETVLLSDILKSEVYERLQSKLTIALGEDISGQPLVADLSKMPHLLVAGTTGSGKSVALNAMILSLLYKSTPEDVRFILIDPKMLELSVYEGIPSLLAPVVTDMKEAANALRWCVAEMEKRYHLMASLGVRNISGYNRKVEEAINSGRPIESPVVQGNEIQGTLEVLPKIVVIIDELADLMMVVGKKVEDLIARLAQKARASGIHLILATQRPSVDVITGLIKANIPSRISFQVSSRVDSRTILDQIGAENLLGHGDMLYLPPGTSIPHRVHGAFVSDEEVHKVVKRLRKSGDPEYVDSVLSGDMEGGFETLDGPAISDFEQDELYDQAVKIVIETRRASVSGIQRRLKIGYNRAARMVEAMEAAGLVGELQPSGTREVLVPPSADL